MNFNERLRELRQEKEPRITQGELAEILKTNQRKISRMETGEAEPNIEDIRLLCLHYNVSADYLLGLPDNLPYPR
ncbi:MAG: helix-turn-helix transcriptional regulator [Oscillospiraceae bacterium]